MASSWCCTGGVELSPVAWSQGRFVRSTVICIRLWNRFGPMVLEEGQPWNAPFAAIYQFAGWKMTVLYGEKCLETINCWWIFLLLSCERGPLGSQSENVRLVTEVSLCREHMLHLRFLLVPQVSSQCWCCNFSWHCPSSRLGVGNQWIKSPGGTTGVHR